MNLKSRCEVQHEHSRTMDFMDVDQVLEVPDTPERLVGTPCNGDCIGIKRQSGASTNNHIVSKDYISGRVTNQPREKGKSVTINGSRRFSIHPDSCSNSPVHQVGSSCSFKNALPMIDAARPDKGKAFCNSNVQRSTSKEGGSSDLTQRNGHGHSASSRVNASRKGVQSLNGFLGIDNLNRSNKSCKLNNSLKIGPSTDCGKGVGIVVGAHHKAESNVSPCMQPSSSSRAPQQKRLVRNGCISPHNIAKSKHVVEKHGASSKAKEVCSGSGTMASDSQSSMVDIKDLIAESEDSRRCKGKGVSCSSEEPDARSGNLSHRGSLLKEPAARSVDFRVDASRYLAESEGWRTTHKHMKERDIEQQKKGLMKRDHINERDVEHLDELEIVSSQSWCYPPETVSRHAHKLGTSRKREGTISRSTGKCSMPCVNDAAGEPSTSRPKRTKSLHGAVTLNPVSEPNTHCANNEDSSVRALQVEADEMLARELQEQLYNDEPTPAAGIHEMDSHLALVMAMQHNNSSRHAGGRRANRRQGPSMLNINQHFGLGSSRRPSVRRGRQPQVHTSRRLARLTSRFLPHIRPNTSRRPSSASTPRNSIFPPNMDVDMRMQILETLEAVGDMQLPNDLLQVEREFNEGDYEMLLALDEDNHQHGGATRAQINNLPQSTVLAETLQECAICLETPSVGETIRHLPCLHRFHKECIDQWLRRKTSCPVCKSSIT